MKNHLNQFESAILVLIGRGKIKNRLIQVFEDYLVDIDSYKLPKHIRKDFILLQNNINNLEKSDLNSKTFTTKILKMSYKEAEDCAKNILNIFMRITAGESKEKKNVLANINMGSSPKVPSFLIKEYKSKIG